MKKICIQCNKEYKNNTREQLLEFLNNKNI